MFNEEKINVMDDVAADRSYYDQNYDKKRRLLRR